MAKAKHNDLLHDAPAKRAQRYARMRARGLSLSEIGRREGITRQRVSSLLKTHGFI